MRLLLAAAAFTLAACAPAIAQPETFTTGPIIESHGKVADTPDATQLPEGTTFKVAFDIAEAAAPDKENRYINSAARFLNLHARAGVPAENMSVAIVVHGPASADLTIRKDNTSAPLIAALIEAGVSIELCGQTAAYRGIEKDDLLPGVTMSHSAMTSHALLQQNGYTLNPF